jgi:hypothetical protein
MDHSRHLCADGRRLIFGNRLNLNTSVAFMGRVLLFLADHARRHNEAGRHAVTFLWLQCCSR